MGGTPLAVMLTTKAPAVVTKLATKSLIAVAPGESATATSAGGKVMMLTSDQHPKRYKVLLLHPIHVWRAKTF